MVEKGSNIEKGLIAAKVATKAIVSIIPVLGSSITSVWSDIEATQAKRKLERLEEFYFELKKDVEGIQDKISSSYTAQPDFLDIFELTARYIVNERNEEKRASFRNILVNSIVSEDCSYDKTEKYLRIVEQMNNLEILILKVLVNPSKYNTQQGDIIKDPNERNPDETASNSTYRTFYNGVYEFTDILSKLIMIPQDDIDEAIYFLESNRLVMDKSSNYKLQTNGNPIHILDDKLTSKGKDFVSFIMRR